MSSKSDEVFLIANNDIRPLPSRPFKAGLFGKTLEDALQTLIEKQPNIINGRQLEPGSADPPRFVLLRREMQVGDWSLDHLLVDQRGVLTLVEAKLLQNPEARRAVIGQILDYAAYAATNWNNGRLKQFAADYWRNQNKDVDDILREAFPDIDIEAFWNNVEGNLANNRIRLIIAADELQPEARRVIEFLNQEMKTVQVFGLEIRCFGEDPHAVIVPFLVGHSQAASSQKSGTTDAKLWTIEQLRAAYSQLENSAHSERLVTLLDWAVARSSVVTGKTQLPIFGIKGKTGERIVSVYPSFLYSILREDRYGSADQRNAFAEEVKRLGMYPADFDPATVTDGKNLGRVFRIERIRVFCIYRNIVSVLAGIESGGNKIIS